MTVHIHTNTCDGDQLTRLIMAGLDKNASDFLIANKDIIRPFNASLDVAGGFDSFD
ncbi:hypothetical protein KSX_35370 [Ktedonospora formicarum]|uniref:Uncharacterized protein n=1 Tax=Ktedonospora formicarum TaxID=2778364 RepID=A0A8J3HX42_9CHLR|nr:hypothetical protein KSX_35370 [Ktedonospora formicarum]